MTKLTASSPRIFPCKFPYLRSLKPPALVETQPPIKQLPFAPRSKGIIKPTLCMCSSKVSRTQPASQTITPAEILNRLEFTFIDYTQGSAKDKTILVLTSHFVSADDLVHQPHRENYLIKNGNTSTNKTSVSTLGTNSQSVLVTIFQYFRNFIRCFRLQNKSTTS